MNENNPSKNNPKEPKHLIILRTLGFVLLISGVILIVLGFAVVRKYDPVFDRTSPTPALFVPGIFAAFFSIPCLIIGFSAKISKMQMDTAKYIQEKNKETMTDIVSNTADIASEGITKTTRAVKKGLKDDENATKFCKHCGEKIDIDSKFCKKCGEEQ